MNRVIGATMLVSVISGWGAELSASNYLHRPYRKKDCQEDWQYPGIRDDIRGIVVFHKTTNELCGIMPTASITLVKTIENDTIRVLELCNISKEFANGELVVIHPSTNAKTDNIYAPLDPRACSLKRTCVGVVESIVKR
ncbi:hypothetical protein KBK19_10535 [Microvirga sp. STR05]|uniref:Peptidase S24/S26A/S26B/S26C domain-containing protein n=1 Tax=Hymenobacter duratus TaxID=2771356 RepID=A0ABR8JJC3_9BACT|nr:hypothetical protein [Hymenobacter duratus]MBD2715472.1 hypothetical protein [Hymenobacter duratus]MBR7950380.1 hypothetical protein [Microvirga sp. STR05]